MSRLERERCYFPGPPSGTRLAGGRGVRIKNLPSRLNAGPFEIGRTSLSSWADFGSLREGGPRREKGKERSLVEASLSS